VNHIEVIPLHFNVVSAWQWDNFVAFVGIEVCDGHCAVMRVKGVGTLPAGVNVVSIVAIDNFIFVGPTKPLVFPRGLRQIA